MSWKDDKNLGSWTFTPQEGWKDDKGLGPWTFTNQPNKPSYNEGDHIATYASPVWSMEEGSNVPITPTHDPCGYWTSGPDGYVPPWTPPNGPYLIGWYKFDEGGGAIVNNYAIGGSGGGGLLPNLTVFNTYAGLFWTYLSGFGNTPQLYFGGGTGADFAWSKPNRTIGGVNKATMGIFLKRKADYGNKGGYALGTHLTATGGTVGTRLMSCNPGANQGWNWIWVGSSPSFPYAAALIDVWLFHFIDPDGYYRIVKPDGTILQSVAAINLISTVQYIYASVGIGNINPDPPTVGLYPGGVSYGDWIIYNSTTLTLAEWADWYDQLRSRYGMAARSGW